MRDDMDTDFCDRLPGQHLGRLSLELQAKEAAEWQRRIDELEGRLRVAEDTICELLGTQSPESVESPDVEKSTVNGSHLPPCPNCGGEPMLRSEERGMKNICWVQCSACGNRTIVRPSWMLAIEEWKRISHPAAGESPTSPEPAQAHGLATPATPSAAVGASEPGAGPFFAHKRIEFLEDRIKQQGRQIAELIDQLDVKDDSISKLILENDRLTKLNHHLREAAVMAIVERVPSDSKPTNAYNPESEDTPQRGNDVTVTDKPFLLEYGKQYLRADGNVSDPLQRTAPKSQKGVTHPFRCPKYDVTYDEDGSHVAGEQCPCDLVAEYLEYQPAESPDDWVIITDKNHIVRQCDEFGNTFGPPDWTPCYGSIGMKISEWPDLIFRCRRKDLPVVEAESPAMPSPPDRPRMRQVTLRECKMGDSFYWVTSDGVDVEPFATGRTAVVEVPE